ncbi:MAG: NADH-quinone oxidoreductase subunit L [Candidatus Methanosuratincola sp.]|nr:NADH-quinone oxidoreductase subunit L [Candidatus Methanosuratincola sp.]
MTMVSVDWLGLAPAWLCWVIPFAGALLVPALGKISRRAMEILGATSVAASSVLALVMATWIPGTEFPIRLTVPWVQLASRSGPLPVPNIGFGILVDPVSIILANVVAAVGALIMVYSIKYMEGEPSTARFWFLMDAFVGSMLFLVMSDNLVQMLFGWEGVGLCSYALIGYWYRDSKDQRSWLTTWVGEGAESYPPSHAGMKAFLMTRFGDVLMIAGVILLALSTGSFSFLEITERVGSLGAQPLLLPASVLILFGAIGKSAQLPLMEWLPDAMTGPAPVSALIHAATMVKAGVYLVARVFPIFYIAAAADPGLIRFFEIAAWVGAATALASATQAAVYTELKKVLAYSTVSQIGYMMLAMGVAGTMAEFYIGYAGGIFHLMSHAVFKAALFLASGSVIHAAGSRFMHHMGGLRGRMPLTFLGTLIPSLSLMGIPVLFGGFWSKDMILEAVLESGNLPLLAVSLATVSITCFYTVRMVGKVFFGSPAGVSAGNLEQHDGHHACDPSPLMSLPVLVLSAATVTMGILGVCEREWLAGLLGEYVGSLIGSHGEIHLGEPMAQILVSGASLAFIVIGAVPAYLFYVRGMRIPDWRPLRRIGSFFANRWYINRAYYAMFVEPAWRLGGWIAGRVEDDALRSAERSAQSSLIGLVERLKKTQTGGLNENLIAVLAGMILLMIMILLVVLP